MKNPWANKDPKTLAKQWAENWKTLGPILEQIRHQELREFDYEKNSRNVLGLLEMAHLHRRPRTTSGLVEMQRLFMKARQ